MAERIGARFGTGAAGLAGRFLATLVGDAFAAVLSAVSFDSSAEQGEEEGFGADGGSLRATRLTAFGLEEADSLMRSVGGSLVVRSLAQVNEPGGWIDHAEPSCGSRGEGVKTGALADTSLASRAVGPRLGVLTFDVEAVVTASASSVEGARPFHTLDGLPVLADQADWSSFDIL